MQQQNKTPKFRLDDIGNKSERVSNMMIAIIAEISSLNEKTRELTHINDCSCDPYCRCDTQCDCDNHCNECDCDHDYKCKGYDPYEGYVPCSCDTDRCNYY